MQDGWVFGEVVSAQEVVSSQNSKEEVDSESISIVTTSKEDARDSFERRANIIIGDANTNKVDLKSKKALEEAEKNMKVGLFCVVLRYFDMINRVKHEKKTWENDAKIVNGSKEELKETDERKRMKEENLNAERRKELMSRYCEKAKRGEVRKLLRTKIDRNNLVRITKCRTPL